MKTFINLFCVGMLAGILCAGFVACDKPELRGGGYSIEPSWYCIAFIEKTPGEETILFARSGYTYEEGLAQLTEFRSQYGEDNISANGSSFLPHQIKHEAPDCYELTLTYEFDESYMPMSDEINSIYRQHGGAMRINNRTAIYKFFFGAFTEKEAEKALSRAEECIYWYEWAGPGTIYSFSNYVPVSGRLKGPVTMKNLGSGELNNVPIEC